jgi:hypothetical protein
MTPGCMVCVAVFFDGADRPRIGYSSISGSYMGLWIARNISFFSKEGLGDKMILIPSGSHLAQVVTPGRLT